MKKLTSHLIPALLFFTFFFGILIANTNAQLMTVSPYKESPMFFYLNCGNEVVANIENYPYLDNIRFEVEGGEMIKSIKAGIFTVVPQSAKVIIRAYEGEKLISESSHPVKLLPHPEIKLFIGSFPYNQRETYTKDLLSNINITVKAVSSQYINEVIPKDARYRVSEFEVSLLRGANMVVSNSLFTEGIADLTEILKNAKSGDFLSIEVKKVERLNFTGKKEEIGYGENTIFSILID